MELCSHITYDSLYVDGMVDDVVDGCVNIGVGIGVDIGSELCELAIELLFPLLHKFGEEGFGEGGIGVGVTHGLQLLGNCLVSRCASEVQGGLVGVQFVNKANSSPQHIYGFVNSFGVEGGIETLKMAPTRLLVLRMVDIVAKVEVDYVVVSNLVLEGHNYGCSGLFRVRLLATKVVPMRSSKGAVDSLSFVMLTWIFSCWKISPYLSRTSLASSKMTIRNTKSLVAPGLVMLINSCCFPS